MSKKLAELFNMYGVGDKPKEEEKPKGEEKPKEEHSKEEQTINFEEKYNRFKEFDIPEFDEIASIIQEEEGEDLPTKVKSLKSKRELALEAAELKKRDEEREQYYRLHKVTESDEFRKKYDTPVIKAKDIYAALISEEDAQGNPRHEEVYNKLRLAVWNDGKEITAAKVKALFKTFSDQYRDKHGVEPELPTIKQVMDAREDLIHATVQRSSAIENWEKLRAEQLEKQKQEQAIERSKKTEASVAENKEKFKNFVKSDPLKDYDFLDEEEKEKIISSFEEEFVDMVSGKKVRPVEEYLTEGAKARAFDVLLKEHQTALEYIEKKLGGLKNMGREKKVLPFEPKKDENPNRKGLSDFFGIK